MTRDKARKAVDRAVDLLRKPGRELVLTHTPDTVSGRSFHIQPDGVRIAEETARKLLEHPRIQPDSDGLLAGHPQSWRLGDWRKWKG
jgi:hypothetical protein